ncbi:MAG: MOP flippase family protein [Anaerolineaceae bacterium]|nr:MAG: MOP flippase family protein [Anaerolineaceae bacterium]
MEEKSLQEQAVKGIAWSATRLWGRQLITFFVFLLLSRLLGPEAFGLVALASVFTAFVRIFLDQGFGAAIIQRSDLEPEHLDTAFWFGIVVGLALTLGGIAAANLIAQLFEEPQLAPIVRWLSLTFLIAALSSTQIAILRRDLAFKSLAVRSTVATVGGGIVAVSFAFLGFGVWSLVAQNLVGSLLGVIFLWRASHWRPGFNFSKRHLSELYGFGLNVIGIKVLDFFNRRSDDFLIGYFLGPVALGYYTIAYRLLLVMLQLLTGITTAVSFPTFSRLQKEPERMRSAFYKVTKVTSLIAFPAFVGILIVAPELVDVLYGSEWAPSVPVMQILALIGILSSVTLFNNTVMKAAGKPSWQLAIMSINMVFAVIGFLIVVRFGIVAVAAAYVITGYLLAPLAYFAVHRLIRIDLRTYLLQYAIPLVGSLGMVAIVMALKQVLGEALNIHLRLSIYVVAGAITYLAFVLLADRSMARQGLDYVGLIFPKLKLSRT